MFSEMKKYRRPDKRAYRSIGNPVLHTRREDASKIQQRSRNVPDVAFTDMRNNNN